MTRRAKNCARKSGWPGMRKNRSVYRLTLDTVDKPNLQLIMYPGKLAEAKKNGVIPKGGARRADDDGDDS